MSELWEDLDTPEAAAAESAIPDPCPACHGEGGEREPCPVCRGEGGDRVVGGFTAFCPFCSGTGEDSGALITIPRLKGFGWRIIRGHPTTGTDFANVDQNIVTIDDEL